MSLAKSGLVVGVDARLYQAMQVSQRCHLDSYHSTVEMYLVEIMIRFNPMVS